MQEKLCASTLLLRFRVYDQKRFHVERLPLIAMHWFARGWYRLALADAYMHEGSPWAILYFQLKVRIHELEIQRLRSR